MAPRHFFKRLPQLTAGKSLLLPDPLKLLTTTATVLWVALAAFGFNADKIRILEWFAGIAAATPIWATATAVYVAFWSDPKRREWDFVFSTLFRRRTYQCLSLWSLVTGFLYFVVYAMFIVCVFGPIAMLLFFFITIFGGSIPLIGIVFAVLLGLGLAFLPAIILYELILPLSRTCWRTLVYRRRKLKYERVMAV
jgi:hypothetical protein